MQLPLRGIVTPLATPLAPGDPAEPSLDASALDRLIEHVIAGGVSGIFLLGTTGESSSFSQELRAEILERTCARVSGRVPVLVNVTDTAVSESLRLAARATETGADAIVVAPPYYFRNSQEDLFQFIEAIASRVTLPVFLYNIPTLTKNSFEPETVHRASRLERVVGLKDSTGDLAYLETVVELMRDRPDFSILIGPEELLSDGMKRGAIGGVCGGSNLEPKLFVDLYGALAAGDEKGATLLQARVQRMSEALYRTGFPASGYLRGLKTALELAGICRAEPALPLLPFTTEERAQVELGYRSLRA